MLKTREERNEREREKDDIAVRIPTWVASCISRSAYLSCLRPRTSPVISSYLKQSVHPSFETTSLLLALFISYSLFPTTWWRVCWKINT